MQRRSLLLRLLSGFLVGQGHPEYIAGRRAWVPRVPVEDVEITPAIFVQPPAPRVLH
jgi:hypothetical protein